MNYDEEIKECKERIKFYESRIKMFIDCGHPITNHIPAYRGYIKVAESHIETLISIKQLIQKHEEIK